MILGLVVTQKGGSLTNDSLCSQPLYIAIYSHLNLITRVAWRLHYVFSATSFFLSAPLCWLCCSEHYWRLTGKKQTLEGVAKKMPVGGVCPIIKYLALLIIHRSSRLAPKRFPYSTKCRRFCRSLVDVSIHPSRAEPSGPLVVSNLIPSMPVWSFLQGQSSICTTVGPQKDGKPTTIPGYLFVPFWWASAAWFPFKFNLILQYLLILHTGS